MVLLNLIWIVFLTMTIIFTIAVALPNVKKPFLLCERKNTETIRGISILMIVVSHIMQNMAGDVQVIGGGYTQRIIGCWGAIGVSIFFFLSGYGNYLALGRMDSVRTVIQRTVLQIVRLSITFILCFMAIGIIRVVLCNIPINTNIGVISVPVEEALMALITLRMPGTTTWYLKVQIFYYVITAMAFVVTSKHRNTVIWLGGIIYVAVAVFCNLPDFWWKTAICFPVGALCAEYKNSWNAFIGKYKGYFIFGSLAMALFAYLWILRDGKFILIPQLAAYAVIALSAVILSSLFKIESYIWRMTGRASLEVYLVHVGLAPALLSGQGNGNIQIIAFCVLTVLLSFMIYKADRRLLLYEKKV